jgi:hypothetical protein
LFAAAAIDLAALCLAIRMLIIGLCGCCRGVH